MVSIRSMSDSQVRSMRPLFIAALLILAWRSPVLANVGDACELTSDCDSGEQCRLKHCVPRKSTPNLIPDEPSRSSARRPSGSNACMTSVLTCPLPGAELSGTVCYCDTKSGPVGGIVP